MGRITFWEIFTENVFQADKISKLNAGLVLYYMNRLLPTFIVS